jgi:nucleotide-binding universal stress UspA family protein
MSAIPVICDRCRATGVAGSGDFTHLGDLLEFDPVPRKKQRVDGWTPDRQRAFIAALSATGSSRRAAHAIGMAPFGADRLREADGSDSFRAAWDRALAIAAQAGAIRLSTGVADVVARNAHLGPATPSRLSPEPEPEADEEAKRELIENVLRKHALKVGQERDARLAGQVVAADFYLRQITWFEVAMDLISGHGAAFRYLHEFRCGEHYLTEIAETPMSRLLDSHRREQWAAEGEPERPEHPPRRYLVDRGAYSLEPLEFTHGGDLSREEQLRRFEEAHTAEAKAQVLWEHAASIEAAQWRKRQRLIPPRNGEGDQPEAGGGVKPKRKRKTK